MLSTLDDLVKLAIDDEMSGEPQKYLLIDNGLNHCLRETGYHDRWSGYTEVAMSKGFFDLIAPKWKTKLSYFKDKKYVGFRTARGIVALIDKQKLKEIDSLVSEKKRLCAIKNENSKIEWARKDALAFIRQHGDKYADMTLRQITQLELKEVK